VSDRRGARFLIEVVFLGALAAGLAFTRLTPIEIVGVMLVGWAIVAMVEWTWSHSEPHFSSGFPPRYVVPKADLPPPRPLEQVPAGYPDATRDEAPTWIAPPALRAEVLGDWPVAAAGVVARPEPEDEPDVADLDPADLPDPDSWTVVELPPAVLEAPEPRPWPPRPLSPSRSTRSSRGRVPCRPRRPRCGSRVTASTRSPSPPGAGSGARGPAAAPVSTYRRTRTASACFRAGGAEWR
jgi:hypothetical protein